MNTLLTKQNPNPVPSRLRSNSVFHLGELTHSSSFPEVEVRYLAAKARLLAAQDEKAEASIEFERARTALQQCFEEIWPERSE